MTYHRRSIRKLVETLVLFIALWGAGTPELRAADLKPGTVEAFDANVRAAEARIAREISSQSHFLALDCQPRSEAELERNEILAGGVPVRKLMASSPDGDPIEAPGGTIQHWRGSILIPGATLSEVMARVKHPEAEKIKQEDVLRSAVLKRDDRGLRLFLRLRRSNILTVVYDTEHDVRYRRLSAGRAWSSSKAVKIAEVLDSGTPRERELPEGRDHGFLWRLNSYWRYQQADGGVIVECESISLSRSIPRWLQPVVAPVVDRIARESMERTLASLRERIVHSYVAGQAVASFKSQSERP